MICAAPPDAFNISNLGKTLDILSGGAGAPVHALYATPEFWQIDGNAATVWTTNWAEGSFRTLPTRSTDDRLTSIDVIFTTGRQDIWLARYAHLRLREK
ncbi:hypothetical protein I540_6006 [Mycobacteroides abscessus subsp. bolletii 1513]|uniref:Uncharacterized protein n=1 Tax=Mycobacteroides abscessus subsp. bolletii 1513 TaxID=1299321 RepID=X8DJA3_9MYCO|nr:hypothetical protein I540_6006 [Mycobacteroides abscessus subsp. bolletii 1513]